MYLEYYFYYVNTDSLKNYQFAIEVGGVGLKYH